MLNFSYSPTLLGLELNGLAQVGLGLSGLENITESSQSFVSTLPTTFMSTLQ